MNSRSLSGTLTTEGKISSFSSVPHGLFYKKAGAEHRLAVSIGTVNETQRRNCFIPRINRSLTRPGGCDFQDDGN